MAAYDEAGDLVQLDGKWVCGSEDTAIKLGAFPDEGGYTNNGGVRVGEVWYIDYMDHEGLAQILSYYDIPATRPSAELINTRTAAEQWECSWLK